MTTTHPSKEQVRDYLAQRRLPNAPPPPSPAEVRRQLGWDLVYDMNPLRQECQR